MGPQIVNEKLEIKDSRKRIRLQNENVDEKCETENSVEITQFQLENVDEKCETENSVEITQFQIESVRDDLINILPKEVLVNIFSYLSREELLLKAALVCKYWKSTTEDSQLWRHIDLKSVPKITTETVMQLLNLSKGIVYINLRACSCIDDSVIFEISKQRRLRTLILTGCLQLSGKIFQSIANCRSLQQLELLALDKLTDNSLKMIAESCSNLTALNIVRCVEVTNTGLSSVLQHCKNIKSWKIAICQKVTDDFLMELAAKSPQTEVLSISYCKFTAFGLKYVAKLPKLIRLDAAGIDDISDSLVSILSNMKTLNLERCWNITNNGISKIVENNPELEGLSVSSYDIDDTALEMILKSSCRLTLICLIINCPVSKHGLRRILQNCPKLRCLQISVLKKKTLKRWQSKYPNVIIREVIEMKHY